MRNVGFCYYLFNNIKESLKKYQLSLGITESLQNKSESSATLNNIGLIYWRQGQFTTAFDYYRRSLKLSHQSGNELETSKSLNFIGLIYWKWSDYAMSLDFFVKSLKIKEKLKNPYEIALTLNNIANIYNELGNYTQALEYSNKSYTIAVKTGDKYAIGRALNNIGVSYYSLKKYGKAEEIQLKSLKIKESAGDKSGVGYSLFNLGNIYFDLKKYNIALNYYEHSLKIREELHDNYGISSLLINIGKTYKEQGRIAKALESYNKSLSLARSENLKELVKNNYLAYSKLYEAAGNYNKAFNYYKMYSTLKDSLYNRDFNTKLAELQVSFESTAKEKEIALLTQEKKIQQLTIDKQSSQKNALYVILLFGILILSLIVVRYIYIRKLKRLLEQKNKEIALRNLKLSEANASKDKFFSIIAHDLKSPFTGLLGYTEILIEDFDDLSKTEIKGFLNSIRSMTKNIFGLIENLLEWSRIQTGRIEFIPQPLNLRKGTEKIISALNGNAVKKEILLKNQIPDNLQVFADETMVQSVMTNLLSNALKFTKRGGTVLLDTKLQENFVEVSVKDTGIGISKEDINKLFRLDIQHTTVGTASEKGTGLGLLLCKELIEKHGGTIRIESEENKGSTFYFTLPIYLQQ